jgi:hypothetical protein
VTTLLFAVATILTPALALGDQPAPVVGSTNTVTADPPVSRPRTTPCKVPLFTGQTFTDYSPKSFSYAPAAACPGPWAKVVFEADFAITAGNQFDRTANVWIGGANVYFGTTPEPSARTARTWHVERDLTDYTALFASTQAGQADLGNLVNGTYTGVITGTADLAFYPLDWFEFPPRTADVVVPLSGSAAGGTVALNTPASTLAQTFTPPTNVERAYLDVFAQSQGGDEFWYTCAPDAIASEVGSCGGTGFRETEITIDGTPAGVAPVYPWIFTGGIDPFLWEPIPGVQTLNFKPYRVDLTPFAGVLSDGAPHTVALGVFSANNYFSATATLLLYTDPWSDRVTGAVTSNTLAAAPSPVVTNGLQTAADGSIGGTVTVTSSRTFAIAGYVETSHGRVATEISQTVGFSNAQSFTINATTYVQDITQATTITSLTKTREAWIERVELATREWPLTVDIAAVAASDGSVTQTTSIVQSDKESSLATIDGFPVSYSVLSNTVSPKDTLEFDASGAFTGTTGTSSSQVYFQNGTGERCYGRTLAAASGALTSVTNAPSCGH